MGESLTLGRGGEIQIVDTIVMSAVRERYPKGMRCVIFATVAKPKARVVEAKPAYNGSLRTKSGTANRQLTNIALWDGFSGIKQYEGRAESRTGEDIMDRMSLGWTGCHQAISTL